VTPELWKQIEGLYHSALERERDERAAYLAEACPDEELRRRIEEMLNQGSDSDLLDGWAAGLSKGTGAATVTAPAGPRRYPLPGSRVGPYKLEAAIGAGGMGQVFRALDTRLHRIVAIKFLLSGDAANSAQRQRFLQEARAASALNHPNIVVLYDIAQDDGVDYLIMEHVLGHTLKDLILRERMSVQETIHLASQIASALTAAHAAGIVHRDVKPANIMVTPDKHVKVLDFGLAKISKRSFENTTQSMLGLTTPGFVMGTVSYMSPEQTRGEDLESSSDIFSLGCVLYQTLTGRLPFRGASTLAIMNEIATSNPPPPSSFRPDLPLPLARLIGACLEKDCKQRPSAGQVAADLRLLALSREEESGSIRTSRTSVAVLPLQLRSFGDEQFLCVALAEAIIHRLSSTGKVLVRPLPSVMQYKDATDWTKAAADLNVDLVVEGGIQKMGSKVRILAQIHRTKDARLLHSVKHDGDIEDLFGLQDRLADKITDVLIPPEHVSTPEPAVSPTKSPLAYDLYMRAVDRLAHWNKFDISSAIEMLRRAVELDPNFADAWGSLADAYARMGMHFDPDPQWFEHAERTITRTLELDPIQCSALCARGILLWSPSRGFQNRAALRAVNAAVKVNPSRHDIRHHRSVILFHMGFLQDAKHDAEQALLVNPKYPMTFQCLGMVAQYSGDYAAAEEFNDRALTLDPGLVIPNIFAPVNPLYMGRLDEARERIRRARQMVPDEPQLTVLEGLIAAHEGNYRRAEELADNATSAERKSVTHTHHTWHYAAAVYAMIGKPEKAMFELRRCATLGLPNYRLFGSDPSFRGLRNNSEFQILLSQLRREHDGYREEFGFSGGDDL